ncbi:MAG: CRTAC1 family protein [Myxococcota bacterium]
MRRACLLAVLGTGCVGAAVTTADGGSSESSGGSTSTADTGESTGGPVAEAPVLFGAPEQTSPDALLYVIVDQPLSAIRVLLADVELPSETFLQADTPAALYRVPADAALGVATLRVERIDDPRAAAEQTIEVVPAPFVDHAAEAGLGVTHDAAGAPMECAESHTGLAWGDYDNDGVADVYFGNVGSEGTLHRGFITAEGVKFLMTTHDAGLAGVDQVSMASFVDIDGDGDQDLYVGRRGENRLFRNRLIETGEATFVEVGAELGLVVDSQRTMGVAFGDYDGDGDLDVYEVNHAYCFPQSGSEVRARDHLFENVGGSYVERTDWLGDAPILESVGFSAAWLDTDRDGDQDLIVINDHVGGQIGFPNALWRNDGPSEDGWRFTEVGEQTGAAVRGVNGMGLAYGDLNDDGYVDFAFTNIGPNKLLLSRGDGTFEDVSAAAGIERASQPWGRQSITWAVHLPDIDNDGDLDLYVTGGRIKGDLPVVDGLFENVGDQRFEERTWSSGMVDPEHGKASALVDFNRDGALDIVTTAWANRVRVYRNSVSLGHHWVTLELEGRGGNRAAIGAIVELEAGGRMRTCFHGQRPSLGGGSDPACHFGLGDVATIDALHVRWPDGSVEEVEPPAVDQRVRIRASR